MHSHMLWCMYVYIVCFVQRSVMFFLEAGEWPTWSELSLPSGKQGLRLAALGENLVNVCSNV